MKAKGSTYEVIAISLKLASCILISQNIWLPYQQQLSLNQQRFKIFFPIATSLGQSIVTHKSIFLDERSCPAIVT